MSIDDPQALEEAEQTLTFLTYEDPRMFTWADFLLACAIGGLPVVCLIGATIMRGC